MEIDEISKLLQDTPSLRVAGANTSGGAFNSETVRKYLISI